MSIEGGTSAPVMVAMKSSRGGCMKKTHSLTSRSFHAPQPTMGHHCRSRPPAPTVGDADSKTARQTTQPASSADPYTPERQPAQLKNAKVE